MHELSLMADLFKKIHQIATLEQAKHVSKVTIEIGALAHISPQHFTEHFDELRAGSLAEHATLDIRVNTDIHDQKAQDISLVSIDVER